MTTKAKRKKKSAASKSTTGAVQIKVQKAPKAPKATAPAPKAAAIAPPQVEEIEDIIEEKPYLTKLELAQLDAAQARISLQAALMDKTKLQQAQCTREYQDNFAALKALFRNHEASKREITEEYHQVLRGVESRLGITMSECTVADDGAVTHQDDIG